MFMLAVWFVLEIFRHKIEFMSLYILLVGLLMYGDALLIYRHDFGEEHWKKGLIILISSIKRNVKKISRKLLFDQNSDYIKSCCK